MSWLNNSIHQIFYYSSKHFYFVTDCCDYQVKSIMSSYVSTQSAEQLLQDMMRLYSDNLSSVHPDMKKLRELLTQLSDEQKLHILQQIYSGLTPLHYAALRGHTEIISALLTSLQSSEDRLKLLMVNEYITPLYAAAVCGRTDSVKMILDCLTADQQLQIMSVQDCDDETAIQEAESEGRTDTVRILREYQQRAKNLMREEFSKLIIHDLHVSPSVRVGYMKHVQLYCVG